MQIGDDLAMDEANSILMRANDQVFPVVSLFVGNKNKSKISKSAELANQ